MSLSRKIYILDDDIHFAEEIKELLAGLGEIETFSDPLELLNYLSVKTPDLILIDLNLGPEKIDGLEVVRRIKQREDSYLIALIMVSGADDSEILENSFKAGIHDYVIKPVMPGIFRPKVEAAIYNHQRMIHTNALTGLPGIGLIEKEFNQRVKAGKGFSVAYSDLDHFKPFNDEKGVKAGDKAIQILSKIVRDVRKGYDRSELFAGHLGGDDFFLIGVKASVQESVKRCLEIFSEKIQELFTDQEIQEGWYRVVDRSGNTTHEPLLSISNAIIHVNPVPGLTFEVLSEKAAKAKKKAKKISGNSIYEENIDFQHS